MCYSRRLIENQIDYDAYSLAQRILLAVGENIGKADLEHLVGASNDSMGRSGLLIRENLQIIRKS